MRIAHSKISHSQLAQCQRNPSQWVSKQVNTTFRGTSYNHCLREGICRFHRDGNLQEAREYTKKLFQSYRLNNKPRIQNSLARFDAYINWFQNEKITTIDSRVRLRFNLGHDLSLGGFILRVDMTPQGYRAILLDEISLRWEEELRMPLIQRGLARFYHRSENKFAVGIQELDSSNLVETSYSRADIDDAEQIVRQLAEVVANEFAKYGSLPR